ncbi:MAG: TlpA disulfide reductase family protein [Rikenellaceae bacterium]
MKKLFSILFLALAINCYSQQKSCTIEGTVVDYLEAKILWLAPSNSDYRISPPIDIPVNEDGSFSYTLEFNESELYSIVFKKDVVGGSWKPCKFLLENDTISFTLYPKNSPNKSVMSGGELNDKLDNYLNSELKQGYQNQLSDLYNKLQELEENAYTPEYNEWMKEMRKDNLAREQLDSLYKVHNRLVEQDLQYNEEGKAIINKAKQLSKESENATLNEITEEANVASLAVLYQYVISNNHSMTPDTEKASLFKEILNDVFSSDYSQNPMYGYIEQELLSGETVVGSKFVDFSAHDLDGNTHKLSDLIKGKVVVLDLWASWCGPCMRTSKSFIPVWEKYNDKGFDIIGVAREKDNTDAMKGAIERIGMKWLNLVEQNDKGGIWSKYNAGNSGGKVILIDSEGKIVAMEFDADELEAHLQELLK